MADRWSSRGACLGLFFALIGCHGSAVVADASLATVTIGANGGSAEQAEADGAASADASADAPAGTDAPLGVTISVRPQRPVTGSAPGATSRDAGTASFPEVAFEVPTNVIRDGGSGGSDVPLERITDAAASLDVAREAAVEVSLGTSNGMCGRIQCDCTLRGVRLWGNVAYVTSGGDFKIFATTDPDLLVQNSFVGSSCGEWAEVPQPQAADFTVEFVTSGEDFQIEYSIAPGVAKPPGAP